MDDLNALCDQIIADIEGRGLEVLPALVVPGDAQATVLWSDPADWATFITAAKEQGARQVFVGLQFADKASERALAQITVSWMQDSAVYMLVQRAAWYANGEVEPVASRAPGELRERDEATLATQLLAFVEGQGADFDSLEGLKALFWESRGVSSKLPSDTETRFLMQKVEASVEKTLFTEESKGLPELVSSCVSWARSQDFKKVTKSNVETFLRDRDLSLSPAGRDALFAETNASMARYST